jgi:putative restriction endonuclease
MTNFQRIHIEDREYFIIDSIQDLRAEDSFIVRENKLRMFDGAGEARKYVGSYTGENGKRLSHFFEYSNWGNTKDVNGVRTYPFIQQDTCFFSKTNLLKYLYDSRVEYQSQEQIYHNDISQYYQMNLESVSNLKNEKIFFSIYDVSDFREANTNRAYIRSNEPIWKLWRRLVLPKISYLSILKLIPAKLYGENPRPLFYFRILLDYQFRSIVHPKLLQGTEQITLGENVPRQPSRPASRLGADDYRKRVLELMPQCPFTKISDERLLIASHIKPYNICIKENREDQAIDFHNGLALTPTYDKLFDQGYITFTDDGTLICGSLLTRFTWERLNINPSAKNMLRIYPENRSEYLEYHRRNVFQDDIEDFL